MNKALSKRIEILIHLIIWSGIFMIFLLRAKNLGSFKQEDGSIYLPLTYGLLTNLMVFYLNAYYLIPRYIPLKKIKAYVLWAVILLLGITLIESTLDHILAVKLYSSEAELFYSHLVLNLTVNGLILGISIGYGFIKNWVIQDNQKQKLEKEKLSAELNFFKAQISPHFLFNTLNMAYASAVKHGDEDTADIIERISGLLRYNLYECNDSKVDLAKELNFIENYISLQTKRLSDDIKHYLNIKIDKAEASYKIAPLILVPFIENVFKHGITVSNPGEIQIFITIQKNHLKLMTKNPLSANKTPSKYSGIGYKNVKARLDLQYKNQYSLAAETESNNYRVELNLAL
ncbi:MAG: histidine kinase [Bacteroidales bacterium]|nr:histidine kinase [Bacteroidales bacterium]